MKDTLETSVKRGSYLPSSDPPHIPVWIDIDSSQPQDIKNAIQLVYNHSKAKEENLKMTVLVDDKNSIYEQMEYEIKDKELAATLNTLLPSREDMDISYIKYLLRPIKAIN